jgi:hypothetical protein
MPLHANDDHLMGSKSLALRGIAKPLLCTVPAGTRLYRFVNAGDLESTASQANRPWWFEYEPFQNMRHFAERNGHTLAYCARLFLAIRHQYKAEISGYVTARTTQSLRAWRGPGSVQYEDKELASHPRDPDRMIPMQGINEIYQLCIPGLGRDQPLFGAAFTSPSYESLP